MKLTTSKEEFLSCTSNKSRFIVELGKILQSKGFTVLHDEGDADLQIVQSALTSAHRYPTVLVGEDTDLLVLLLHYSEEITKPLYLKSEPKKGCGGKVWNINSIRDSIGIETCKLLLFAHAFLGCDTTSKRYGVGKATGLKLIRDNEDFKMMAETFFNKISSVEDIDRAGERAMVIVYGGEMSKQLNKLRYEMFQRKVAVATSFVNPSDIPPTSAAMKFHSRRTYYQVRM